MTDRLSEIQARAEAATPGPWKPFQPCNEEGYTDWWVWRDNGDPFYNGVVNVSGREEPGAVGDACITDGSDPEQEHNDAAFIAHAREDIPYLLAEVERLRAALELGYRATESRNLLAAASDEWGTTPMLAKFHEKAGEILWPKGGES